MFSEIEFFNKMLDAGADGFLLKNAQPDELKEAINTVVDGNKYFSKEFAHLMTGDTKRKKSIHLSEREKEILQMICEGYSANEIADKLFLSVYTVEGHRKNIMLKAECTNTASLVAFAIKNQIVNI